MRGGSSTHESNFPPHPSPLPHGEGILWGFLLYQGGGQEGDGVRNFFNHTFSALICVQFIQCPTLSTHLLPLSANPAGSARNRHFLIVSIQNYLSASSISSSFLTRSRSSAAFSKSSFLAAASISLRSFFTIPGIFSTGTYSSVLSAATGMVK